jgi:hypothetical protein
VSQWLVDKAASLLKSRSNRRDFLATTAVVGSALVVAPKKYILEPGTAYAAVCGCLGQECPCGSLCCSDGYHEFCCTINNGLNSCPAGTFAGGWWKADGSVYCNGPRYYIDCVGECSRCNTDCSQGHYCPSCDTLTCGCANGDCNNRRSGCRTFRYGQCHLEIGCSGRIACRVVSCTPAWELDPTCTPSSATDNNTANHIADCLINPPPPPIVSMVAAPDGLGYWMAATDGAVFSYGSAQFKGSMGGALLNQPVVGMAATTAGNGYWLVASDGGVFGFDAPYDGSTGGQSLNKPVVAIVADRDGRGYWLVASDGGVFAFNAPFLGSAGSVPLNKPIVGMAVTPDGSGYWLVASDGGVFAYGNAQFYGSAGGLSLKKPIAGMAATPDGKGYWLVASDGGVFAYGNAQFYGSAGGINLARPIVAIVPTPDAGGYWLAASDGGVFAYGNAGYYGSPTQQHQP